MKKWISILLSLAMMMTLLTGCGKDKVTDSNQNEPTTNPNKGGQTEVAFDQYYEPESGDPIAEIVIRDYGSIFVRFFDDAAPKAVENFITHAKDGYYDGLTFHRILEDFMIQGGDPTGTGTGGESIWGEPFEDEFNEDYQPYRGALCMANSGPNTNGSQFFIVQSAQTYDEAALKQIESQYKITFNEKAKGFYATEGGTPWLYKAHTVFGQVYEGFDVLDAVASVELADASQGTPTTQVIIEKINIYKY